MTGYRFISPAVAMACMLLLTGCGGKDTDEAEKKPAPAAEAQQKGVVELTNESRQNAKIETVTLARTNILARLKVPGRISYDLNRTAKVTSPFAGRILKMNYDIGASVKQGDVMAVIDSPESLKPLELKAPTDGTVTERQGTVGSLLDAAKELYTISDLSRVWCVASIGEEDGGSVQVGQPVTLRVLTYPTDTFTGTVAVAGQAVDETTRTMEARIEIENPEARLKPGMFATVSLPTGRMENELILPDEAVQTISGQVCVFVEDQPGKYRVAVVHLGREVDGQHEILKGVEEGKRVVVSGAFVLKSELLKASMEEP